MTMIEIRWHGRGGQGVWTASNLLATAALREGKNVQSFPEFGPERSGAPVKAFTRISDEEIRLHCHVYNPDISIVLDPTLIGVQNVAEGIKENGVLLANTEKNPEQLRKEINTKTKIITVPATKIAVEILGKGITNTAMLGALIKINPIVKLETLNQVIKERFPGEKTSR